MSARGVMRLWQSALREKSIHPSVGCLQPKRNFTAASNKTCPYHAGPIPLDKCGGLKEFSVVYTDRATNHMSTTFQETMKELHGMLTETYKCKRAVLIPGSGTFGMEAIARQLIPNLTENQKVLVLRNGYFSFRWSDIFTQCGLAPEHIVLKAKPADGSLSRPAYEPHPIDLVLDTIRRDKPAVVFAPHIETSTGIRLPDDYVKQIAAAVHEYDGLFVLDGIAAGVSWVDMSHTGADFYITAPQKGWSSPAAVGVVMMGQRGYDRVMKTQSNSMVLNLRKWNDVMETYLDPEKKFSYYTTMPTDAIMLFRDNARETIQYGLAKVEREFDTVGKRIMELLQGKYGLKLVAADGFRASGVVVAYTDDKKIVSKFMNEGMQIAAGVPFQLGEPPAIWEQGTTFRFGLFGLDKVYNADMTVQHVDNAMAKIFGMTPELGVSASEPAGQPHAST